MPQVAVTVLGPHFDPDHPVPTVGGNISSGQPVMAAGDVLFFAETATHGTLPWKGKHERRAVLYKFSPGFQAYSGGSHEISYPDYIEDMNEDERAVMEAPHIRRR